MPLTFRQAPPANALAAGGAKHARDYLRYVLECSVAGRASVLGPRARRILSLAASQNGDAIAFHHVPENYDTPEYQESLFRKARADFAPLYGRSMNLLKELYRTLNAHSASIVFEEPLRAATLVPPTSI